MRTAILALTCALFVTLPATAQDKIYKSTDAQGNTVYSGVPTAEAEQVKLEPTNTADSVEVRPPEPRDDAPARSSPTEYSAGQDSPVIIMGDDMRDDVYEQQRQGVIRERIREGTDRPKPTPLPQPAKPGVGGGSRR